MPPLPQKFLIGFRIPKSISTRQIHNAALDLWGTDFNQVAYAVAVMDTYQEFERLVYIRAETRRQAATAIYWALSIGAGACAVNQSNDSSMPLMFFANDLKSMPALTAVHKTPIDIDLLYDIDLSLKPPRPELPIRPSEDTIILPPPLDSMLPSRREPTPDIVVPYFEIGFTLDRFPSNEMIGQAVADLFPLQPTAWQYHIHDLIHARERCRSEEYKSAFVWIAANDRAQAGRAIYWGVSLGQGVAVIDSHAATALPLESFLCEATLMIQKSATAIDNIPITEEFLRSCDIEAQIAKSKAE